MALLAEPSDGQDGVRYHDTLASDWDEKYTRGSFRRRLRFLDRHLKTMVAPRSRWLDLGCGSGRLTRRLEELGARGEAIDGSVAMIRAATEHADAAGFTAFRYRVTESLDRIDCSDEEFDGVLCSSVVEYVSDWRALFDEVTRVLKPGGAFLISVPNKYSLLRSAQKISRRLSQIVGMNSFQYLAVSRTEFSRSELTSALSGKGLLITRIDGFDPIIPHLLSGILPRALIVAIARKGDLT